MTKTIEVTISPKGETKIETKGFAGSECRQASRFMEEALGVRVSEKLATEFYQQVSPLQSVTEGQV
ncbi:DUF2997 domain-containing protein [Anatilimnocola floriformis]|uniref:DUF2997 domain-containing protein n=1 Tax=Anatilimnocola floriformis TaxID=2948575 RepID=UPI0020C4EEE0|nr:DUF2997 domain-containing protein [Anatilimnocola floriformis]